MKDALKRFVLVLVALMVTIAGGVDMGVGRAISTAMAEEITSYININDYGNEVIALHQKLRELGYYTLRPESPYGPQSKAAVSAIQYLLDLPETGVVDSRSQYDQIMSLDASMPEFEIKKIKGIDEYLEYLGHLLSSTQEHRMTVFISVRDEASNKLKDSTKEKLRNLGLQTDWNDRYRKAYIAVVEKDRVVEEIAAAEKTGAPITAAGEIDGGVQYRVQSSGYENDGGSNSSIVIDGKEWAKKCRGLNVVVVKNSKVIDSVGFDTWASGNAIAVR